MLNLLAPLCIARRLIVQEYRKGRLFYILYRISTITSGRRCSPVQPFLKFPGMIERVPCRSAHRKARSPCKAITSARCEAFLAGYRSQLRKELFPNRCFLFGHVGRIGLPKGGAKRREVHLLGLQQVQAHRARRSPSLRLHVVEVCWNTVQNVIEGGPAGCKKADVSLNILLFERLSIRCEKNTGRAEVSRSCSRHALADLERLEGGRCTKGETGALGHLRIVRGSGDELVQRRHLIFACSTPPDPREHLGEHATFGSHLKCNCILLHTGSLIILALAMLCKCFLE